MVNAWSLAYSALNGTMEEDYPIKKQTPEQYHYPPSMGICPPYTLDAYNAQEQDDIPYKQDFLADNDDNAAHHFSNVNSSYNDGWTQEFHQKELDKLNNEVKQSENMAAHYFKYHEEEILKDIEEYVSSTYRGHYTGTSHEYRKVQTLDLLAARDIASGFCQANILKYGSRYGSKEGKEKKDLMKVIHYAMLLLHFDDHYGKPSETTGNIDFQMP